MKEAQYRNGRARKKKTEVKKPLRSTRLPSYTHLTPEQLEFIKGSTGEGLSSVFTTEGRRSLEFLRRLTKAKRKCKKFVLVSYDLGRPCYIANKKLVWDFLREDEKIATAHHMTFNIEQALHFYNGFDNPDDKLKFYSKYFPKLAFSTKPL